MRLLRTALLALAASAPALADVKLPALFGDHMVLQRDAKVPIWGWADAGETVRVSIDGVSAEATAGADGKWRVALNALPLTREPTTMTVAGKNTIVVQDVLVGDVWVCGGQSNMGWSLIASDTGAEAAKTAADDGLRLFIVQGKIMLEPQDDVEAKWVRSAPAVTPYFSAVGYFFGRDLRRELGVPLGLISTSLGGTSNQAWMSREALAGDPAFARMLAEFDRDQPKLRALTKKYDNVTVPAYNAASEKWRKEINPTYQRELKRWNNAVKAAKEAGQPEPPKPQPSVPRPTLAAAPNRMTPVFLQNANVAPLVPYAIKGVAWYQGEHNTGDPALFRKLFPALVADWRKRWGQGDFPWVYVQISGYGSAETKMNVGLWPFAREAQYQALADITNAAMVVAADVGDPKDVHPRNKQPVGQRLALAALKVAYGKDVPYSGPTIDRVAVSGSAIRLTFGHADDGLMAGTPPTRGPFATRADAPLKGFEIAGEDRKFVPATATIDGNAVVVSSDVVKTPVAVRYGWADNVDANLYNAAGLPAVPFRTDDWEK
jgi:sialate O-acetylesterase